MKREIGANRLQKTKKTYRFLAIFLCILMVFSISGVVPFSWAKPLDSTEVEDTVSEETQEDLKASLMERITYEGWDPYSSDMTLNEFYALMELFKDGSLPLKSKEPAKSPSNSPIIGATGMDEPGIEEPMSTAEEFYIPRNLFLMSGLKKYSGSDAPDAYDNTNGSGTDYPAGLDNYGVGYYLPPTGWSGVPATKTKNTEAFVIVPNINDGKNTIAGDVDQSLFPEYDGYYVRRVTAEGAEINILGAIKLPGSEEYVYYYLTSDTQSTDVSTTMLPEGQKFIIQYQVSEHVVDYQLYMNDIGGEAELPNGVTLDSVFGADRPVKTDDGKYAFTATAPYGYTLELYVDKDGADNKTLLGWDSPGDYTDVNEGWALGKEPDYKNGKEDGGAVTPNPLNGPSSVTMSGTIYNNDVQHDRTVIGVLKAKGKPKFLFAPLYKDSENVLTRGTTSYAWYDTDLDWAVNSSKDPALVKAAEDSGHIKDYQNFDRAGKYPNIFTADGWGWKSSVYHNGEVEMTQEADGTYSHSFLFQTNSSDNFVMDTLSINGVSITIPFYPKYVYGTNTDYTAATGIGLSQCVTEATLPDGVFVRVEHLLVFYTGTNPQRHYRITVSGARSNVSISAMNLMQYRSGAPEFSAYYLKGVVADAAQTAGVQFYGANGWETAVEPTIHVREPDYNGDKEHYYANFRFKLADGYGNPYFLWESTKSGAIGEQGSGKRDELTGEVKEWNSLESYPPQGEMDTTHIYGPDEDDYYYFRVTTQDTHKLALLTVVARPVRYVVRYVPSYDSVGLAAPDPEVSTVGIIDEPDNMPEFVHDDEKCHPSFHWGYENGINGWEYDDKYGDYYDTAIDTVVILPTNIPEDPDNKYVFVDWVLVDDNFETIKDGNDNELHYRSSNIVLADINQYSIANENLGGNETDVFVLRLMPTWRKIENPFNYKVALNWVDAQGDLHEDFFDDYWRDVVTDWNIDRGGLTVKVLKGATPFADWIAQHPTYTFWDGVNNNNALYRYYEEHPNDDPNDEEVRDAAYEAMSKEMENAIQEYLPSFVVDGKIVDQERYEKVLNALCRRDITGDGAEG
ncbi:MAG: hypothetical protein J1F11_13300, partial [Oscillospiraceae bacterium]|nr:hypothetical protein [Oscillospiraceae bacterium]